MDAHYDQVMRARAEITARGETPPRLYFAYSTILDRAAFEEWRQQHGYDFFDLPEGRLAEALDVDLAFDFPSRWWGGRVAGLVEAPGRSVWGRLFEIAAVDWPIVEHKEGAITGMCVERPVKVRLAGEGGAVVAASAFATNPARARLDGAISARFIEALERGAAAAGLPPDYVSTLRNRG